MKEILTAWQWDGPVSELVPYGEGHINQTYAITVTSEQGAKRYILQKINTNTFKDPAGLMENVCGITDFLREKAKQRGADPARATLHVVPTKEEKPYYQAADGSCWRIYEFVENTVCLQQVQSAEDFYQSAVAFGNFQHQLAEYPAHTLHETIPHFHDTPKRFADFQRAVAEDRMGRAAQVQREIEFVRAREAEYHVMVDLLAAGKLPLRVTHNDTKLNNILFDKTTGEGLCVIDLDTVMPGLAANDFGDSIRFGANHCAEDEAVHEVQEIPQALGGMPGHRQADGQLIHILQGRLFGRSRCLIRIGVIHSVHRLIYVHRFLSFRGFLGSCARFHGGLGIFGAVHSLI